MFLFIGAFINTFIKILSIFTLQEKRKCAVLLVCMICGGIFEAVGISAIFPLVSILGDPQFLQKHDAVRSAFASVGIAEHIPFVFALSALLVIWYIGKNLYMVWITKCQIAFVAKKQVDVAQQLMAYYLRKSYLEHLEQNSAALLRNLQSSIRDIFSQMILNVFFLLTEAVIALAIWSMLAYIDFFTATVVLGVFAVLVYSIIRTIQRKLALQGAVWNACLAEFTKWLNQGLGAIKETKVLRKEAFFWQAFSEAYGKCGDAQQFYTVTSQLPKFFIEACVTIGLLTLIIVKLLLGASPEAIIPLLGVLALAAFRLMPCANRIVSFWGTVKYQLPAFAALYADLMAVKGRNVCKNPFVDAEGKKLVFSRAIEIQSLSFCYPKGTCEVLQDISFTIPKGSFVGIIGQSGAGKTTFVDILLGLLEPTNGTILVDGQDMFQNIRGWQANLAYVPQSIYLIDGSIRENIAIGVAEAEIEDAKVERVLRMAELYDFVQSLPDGLETSVGERGVKLSGGQRQRIGIARALYQEPKVLILDEATSALDNETEKNITDTILKLKGRITIIAIAHRVSTLEHCDFKVKFENGRAQVLKERAADGRRRALCLSANEGR